jgi:protein MpaA
VLVIGVIHGDEDAGIAIVDELREMDVPTGIDLWLIEAINPDGVANQVRGNANGVDLNRNFPYNWQPLSEPGEWEYGGSGPASEPETRAVVDFVSTIEPALSVWYHQDLFRVSPGQGLDGLIRARYAELTGLPVLRVTGGTYTGVAATWQRQTFPDSIAFIVELGESLSTDDAHRHAAAVLDIAGLVADQPTGTSP